MALQLISEMHICSAPALRNAGLVKNSGYHYTGIMQGYECLNSLKIETAVTALQLIYILSLMLTLAWLVSRRYGTQALRGRLFVSSLIGFSKIIVDLRAC